MTAAEYQQLLAGQEQLRQHRDAERQRAEAEAAKAAKALAEKGQIEDALKTARATLEADLRTERERAAQLTQRVHERERRAALGNALVAFETATKTAVRPEARPLIEQLWAGDFEVVDDPTRPDSFVVRERGTLRPIADVIADRLKAPSNALFLSPTTRGGTATPANANAGPAQAADPEQPRNLGEALALQFLEARKAGGGGPAGLAGRR